MNAPNKVNPNTSSTHADGAIITCGATKLDLTYDELTRIDAWLSSEVRALQEQAGKKFPKAPKFFLDQPKDPRYLGPEIERHNQIVQR
jgi:hypothetical protein